MLGFSLRTAMGAVLFSSVMATSSLAMEARQTVEREIVVRQADGTVLTKREPATVVRPGDNVVYTINFTNTTAEPATDLVMAMPVPSEVRFIDGSADKPGMDVLYSTDGGQSYSPRQSLQVTLPNGASRTAQSEDITHIQWKIAGPIAVGDSGSVSYKAQLK